MAESTPAKSKSCRECDTIQPLQSYPRVGVGRGPVCHPCRDEEIPGPGCKVCTKCKKAKPFEDFSPRLDRPGPMPRCKVCTADVKRERYAEDPEPHRARRSAYYWTHRDEQLAAVAKWRRENPPDPTVERQKRRARYLANPEKQYASAARWRAANLERHRANARNWAARHRAENLDHVREVGRRAMARRRARLRGLPSESYTLAGLLARDGTDCVLCGDPLDLLASYPDPNAPTVEHLECLSWPDATAGDVLSNCGVSHWGCNNARRDKPHPAAARKRAELLAQEQTLT